MSEAPRLRSKVKESISNKPSQSTATAKQQKQPITFLDSSWSWSRPSSWPLSIRFLPLMLAFVVVFLGVYVNNFYKDKCLADFEFGFNIHGAAQAARELSKQHWELGITADAIRELRDPELSVFSANPFPKGKIPKTWYAMDKSSAFLKSRVQISEVTGLVNDSVFISEAAALGISGVLLAQHLPGWVHVIETFQRYYCQDVPKNSHGALHHSRAPEGGVAAEALYMVPPFLAYYAVWSGDTAGMEAAIRQVEMHRTTLLIDKGERKGLWQHSTVDRGAWSVANAMAAYGILRVRAMIYAWDESRSRMFDKVKALDEYVLETLHGAMRTDTHDSGLLRNYLGDETWDGETTGTSLLAAAAYRMVVILEPGLQRDDLVQWADRKRNAVMRQVDMHGIARAVINSTIPDKFELVTGGTSEGQAFLLIMASAWRSCVCAGVCSDVVYCTDAL